MRLTMLPARLEVKSNFHRVCGKAAEGLPQSKTLARLPAIHAYAKQSLTASALGAFVSHNITPHDFDWRNGRKHLFSANK
jgi:hypothetical protein